MAPAAENGGGGVRRAPQSEAAAIIVDEVARKGWGYRHLVLGASGVGKSFWLARLATYTVEQGGAQMVLIHDAKDPVPQDKYARVGTVRASVAQLAARPLAPGESPIVIIHDRDHSESPDRVAEAGITLGRDCATPTLVLIDEIYDALKGRQAFASGTEGPVSLVLRKGRSWGVSITGTTQIPQTLPTEFTDLPDTVAFFRLADRSQKYVSSAWGLTAEQTGVVERLGEGEFILGVNGQDWDRTVYGPAL